MHAAKRREYANATSKPGTPGARSVRRLPPGSTFGDRSLQAWLPQPSPWSTARRRGREPLWAQRLHKGAWPLLFRVEEPWLPPAVTVEYRPLLRAGTVVGVRAR